MTARRSTCVIFLSAIILPALWGVSSAQTLSPAPSPAGSDCLAALLNLSDCLSYVEEGSNLTVPDKPCCPELAGLVKSSPVCLCQLLGDPEKAGFKVDVKKALHLPSVCHVTTPPASLCSVLGYPVGVLAPASAPAPAPSEMQGAQQPVAGSSQSAENRNYHVSVVGNFLLPFSLLFLH